MSLITSENQIVCFPSFVLTVFWCSTSYTVLIVFWKMLMKPVNAPTRWWPCARLKFFSGLRRPEKNLIFWDAYMSLTWCSNMVDIIEGNWLQLLFYLIVLMGVVASDIGMSFFSYVSGFRLKFFSYCTLTETFAIGFQKWFDHEWIVFGSFC